jgi:hypothetical protein
MTWRDYLTQQEKDEIEQAKADVEFTRKAVRLLTNRFKARCLKRRDEGEGNKHE